MSHVFDLLHASIPFFQGLRVSRYYGNFQERLPTDLALGVLDSDKAVSALIEHSRTLDERQYAYLQCAVLYTSIDGQRRVRTCNLALQVVSLAGNVFRYADMDAVVCHLVRDGESLLSALTIVRYLLSGSNGELVFTTNGSN